MSQRTIILVGGTSGIGRKPSPVLIERGDCVVLISRDPARAAPEAIGGDATGIALDLAQPETPTDALVDVGDVNGLVLSGIERDANTVRELDIARATRIATL